MSITHDMPSEGLFGAICELNNNTENRMVTVIDGDFAGEKAVISIGGFFWMSDVGGFIASHEDEILSLPGSGLFETDGVRVFAEVLANEKHIVICGAGHVSMPIISVAKMMGCRVTVIDDRLRFAENAMAQGADNVIFKPFEEALREIPGDGDTFFIIVTRGHRYDKECLRSVTRKPHAYIGMMGSRRRVAVVKKDLAEEGIPCDVLDSVYTPIGLSIGAETPEEIAVSVMAEIIEVKNRVRRTGGFTKEILDKLLPDERERMTLATIISRHGSAPRDIGTRMLIAGDGSITGTIGGGCIEGKIIAKGRRMLLEEGHKPVVMEIDLANADAGEEGMICGGTVEVFLEIV